MTNRLARNETKRQKGEKRALEGDAKGRHEGKLFAAEKRWVMLRIMFTIQHVAKRKIWWKQAHG
jgi:hypothetical protein